MSEVLQSVELSSAMGPIRIRLLDHQFNEVAHGYGKLNVRVKPGIYLVQTSAGGWEGEEIITVRPNADFRDNTLEAPIVSAAPISGEEAVRRCHAESIDELCRHPILRVRGERSGLVLFVRDSQGIMDERFSLHGMEVCDAEGALLARLGGASDSRQGMVIDHSSGWAGMSAELNPGGYLLKWTEKRHSQWAKNPKLRASVAQPLWVEKGWTTVVMMACHPERFEPRMTGMSIYMAKFGEGLRLALEEQREVALMQEMALNGIRQGVGMISGDFLHRILNAKYRNPMAGVLGAHALLLKRKVNWNLFDTVIANLSRLLPYCPDVVALRMMGKMRRKQTTRTRTPPIKVPPMLYPAYQGVLSREWNEGGVILPGSLAEKASAKLLPQGPWTVWKTEREPEEVIADIPPPPRFEPSFVETLGEFKTGLERDTKKWWQKEISTESASADDSVGRQVKSVLGQIAASGIAPSTDMFMRQFRDSGVPMSGVMRVIDSMEKKTS